MQEKLQAYWKRLGEYTILTQNRKYVLEVSLLYVLAIFLVNYISPKTNALYFLLLFPAIAIAAIGIYCLLKIINRPEFGIPVIAFLLPFERIGALASSSFNIRSSQVFTLITLGSYIAYVMLKDKKYRIGGIAIKKDPAFFLLLLFSLVNIISLSTALNLARSIDVLLFDLFAFFTYIFISNLLISKDILRKVVWALLLVTLIVGLFGIFQFLAGMLNLPTAISGLKEGYTKIGFGFPRVQATESEPQFWGNFLITPVCLAVSILLASFNKKEKPFSLELIFLCLADVIIGVINILMTFSRGAWYAVVGAFAILFVFYIKKFLNPKIILTFVIVFVLGIAGFVYILQKTGAPLTLDIFTNRATAVVDNDRVLTTTDALHDFSAHKILGIGVGEFGPYEAANIYQKPQAYGQDIGWRIVNNEYLEILTETGIIGIAVFSLFLLYMALDIFKALQKPMESYVKAILIGFTAAFAGILIQYIGFSTLYVMQIWFTFAIISAITFNITRGIWKKE